MIINELKESFDQRCLNSGEKLKVNKLGADCKYQR